MIILRDAALIAAVFYVRYKTLSPPVSAQHLDHGIITKKKIKKID